MAFAGSLEQRVPQRDRGRGGCRDRLRLAIGGDEALEGIVNAGTITLGGILTTGGTSYTLGGALGGAGSLVK
ncbi:MAG: hypothetical protein ACO3ZY_02020 [Phycisphaerales bacterium]